MIMIIECSQDWLYQLSNHPVVNMEQGTLEAGQMRRLFHALKYCAIIHFLVPVGHGLRRLRQESTKARPPAIDVPVLRINTITIGATVFE